MDLKRFFADDDAVSPVIGVILMVAITVILAAVIGAFVLDLGGNQERAPQASWSFEYDDGGGGYSSGTDDAVTISHDGGEDISNTEIFVTVGGGEVNSTANMSWDSGPPGAWSAGSSATISEDSAETIASGDSVKIVWEAESGDSSNIIGEGQVP